MRFWNNLEIEFPFVYITGKIISYCFIKCRLKLEQTVSSAPAITITSRNALEIAFLTWKRS